MADGDSIMNTSTDSVRAVTDGSPLMHDGGRKRPKENRKLSEAQDSFSQADASVIEHSMEYYHGGDADYASMANSPQLIFKHLDQFETIFASLKDKQSAG